MADSSQHPSRPRRAPGERAPAPAIGPRAVLVTLVIVAGSAAIGIAGGLAWSLFAPQAVFSVSSPGVAFVVNPETTAFIAADAWYAIVAGAGGFLIGLAAWLGGVRRHGPLPVAGALAGATLAAFAAAYTGSHVGLAAFRHQLGTGRAGQLIRQPPELGARGALAFWPLAAGLTIGAIELILALRDRRAAAPLAAPYAEPRPAGPAPAAPPAPGGALPFSAPPARRSADQ